MHKPEAVSIVIPTYNEALNIQPLIDQLVAVDFQGRSFEVIIMDDCSPDGTEQITRNLMRTFPWLRIIVRHGKRKGLSRSVLDGFTAARHPLLVVMDADLSHPPEKIPLLLNRIEKNNIDMAIGSRYVSGGSTEKNWPILRKLISRTCAATARFILSLQVQDPLSGFIAIKKSTLASAPPLNTIGWKIGLELMIRCRCREIAEVPIHFQERIQGQSKLKLSTGIALLKHLLDLWVYKNAG